MNPVIVRNVKIGEGIPKICVPVVERTREAILSEAESFDAIPADIVEWRVDWYEDALDIECVLETACQLRETLKEIPLLFTFRTEKEGGARAISEEEYETLNIAVAKSGFIDLLDVEAFRGEELVKRLITEAHAAGVKVIASNHDFEKTPGREELIRRLTKMQELGADIPKIAVMPQNGQDVLTLLSATFEMSEKIADRPIITMSMAGNGVVSRLAGEIFGSALTFGSAKTASAPGQIDSRELEHILKIIHSNL